MRSACEGVLEREVCQSARRKRIATRVRSRKLVCFSEPPVLEQRVTGSMLRAACYGQNAVLQPYDLPVTRGGQVCKTLQSETMGEEDHHHSLELMLMHGLHRRERFSRGNLFLGIGSIQS